MAKKHLIAALFAATALTACASPETRYERAVEIANNGAMTQQVLHAGLFNLMTWQRLSRPGVPVNVYIEGDGMAWRDKHTKSMNPTPPDPITLRMATVDRAENVVYIARPCQYTGWNGGGSCPDKYWTNARTAEEIIQSYILALDELKNNHGATGFHLIGYSGGAAVAALVAARRTDILSLRTVAGNTHYAAFTTLHQISPMAGSLNPEDIAAKISYIPQQHYIGAKDTVVPVEIFNSWQKSSGTTTCIRSTLVADTTHDQGWPEKWAELFSIQPHCAP